MSYILKEWKLTWDFALTIGNLDGIEKKPALFSIFSFNEDKTDILTSSEKGSIGSVSFETCLDSYKVKKNKIIILGFKHTVD